MAKLSGFLERKFDLKNKGTSVKTELVAGLTTFMAMVYILMVNAGMFTEIPNGPSYGAMYIVTAISAIVGTILIGWLSGLPLAQAPGMGLNAFFVYTICLGFKFSYANALVFVLLDGLVFIVLTLTGLREKIFKAIPENIKKDNDPAVAAAHVHFDYFSNGHPQVFDRRAYGQTLHGSKDLRHGVDAGSKDPQGSS